MAPAVTLGIDEKTYASQTLNQGRMGFSGCDVNAIIRLPQYKNSMGQELNPEKVFRIGTLQTISISTYNSKTPVKALGFKNPIAVARGGRTIAGSMIFNQLHLHVFDDNNIPSGNLTTIQDDGFLTYSSGNAEYIIAGSTVTDTTTMDEYTRKENLKKQWDFSWDTTLMGERSKPSDLPPFDIVILMVNELGNVAKIVIYGVDIIHDSQTLSVEDIYTEVQYQYIARDIEYFTAYDFEEAKAWSSGPIIFDKPPADPAPAINDDSKAAGNPAVTAPSPPSTGPSKSPAPADLPPVNVPPAVLPLAPPATVNPGAVETPNTSAGGLNPTPIIDPSTSPSMPGSAAAGGLGGDGSLSSRPLNVL